MSEEQFDIVDESDRPTGTLTTKKEAHAKGYPHRVVAVLVLRENGKLLIQEHKLINRLLDHTVGGHVSAGETYLRAAIRETKEELDLKTNLEEIAIGVSAKVKDPRPEFQKITHFYGVYKAVVPNNWHFKPTEEVDSIIELDVENTVKMMEENPEKFLSGFFITLAAYLKKINSPLRVFAYGQNWGNNDVLTL
jgi:isopentenyl-diphosphate Delta-isomerase